MRDTWNAHTKSACYTDAFLVGSSDIPPGPKTKFKFEHFSQAVQTVGVQNYLSHLFLRLIHVLNILKVFFAY